MRTQSWRTWLALVMLLGLISACGQSSLEIGMVETHLPGQWDARYTTFTGTKMDRIRAEGGETLRLEYQAEVDKGRLDIRIEDPAGEALWEVSLQEARQDSVEVVIEEDGRYAIAIEGSDTEGSFDLSWTVE